MRVMKIAAAMLLLAAPVFAQDEPARKTAVEVAARVPFERALKGAPYSAETVVEGSQTLADGNRITRKTTGRVYRDSEGRTRREEDVRVSAVGGSTRVFSNGRTVISIVDPVAGFSYSLDPENKVAWRTPMGVGGAIMNKLEAAQTAERRVYEERITAEGRREAGFRSVPMTEDEKQKAEAAAAERRAVAEKWVQPTLAPTPAAGAGGRGGGGGIRARSSENAAVGPLERRTIEGVAVEGRKTTTVIPAGQVGNEQPITITSEEWRAPELNLLVLTRHSDPRTGESIYRLQNIIRAEPDRSLFMVPADYTVKDTGIRKMLEASMKK
jgi:hypothetical protein